MKGYTPQKRTTGDIAGEISRWLLIGFIILTIIKGTVWIWTQPW